MAPVSELRLAIPYAWSQGMNHTLAYVLSVIGNIIPVAPLLLFLGPVSKLLRRFGPFDKFFSWWFSRTLRRSHLVEEYEALGLVLFVMIPFPVTGAWTGSVAAFLLGIRFRFAFPAIIAGVLLAGIIVSSVCLGVIHIPFFIKH
ncbi:small multi-drug export protein [bacterium]|nr:small multi-drug export protein [bacterium]